MAGSEEAGFTRQSGFELRVDWGEAGLRALAGQAKTFVIVDVLSFSSCVTLGCARGAEIFPYLWNDERVTAFAAEKRARVAGARGSPEYSLSPASFQHAARGERVVLPSPNGSQLSFLAAESGEVFAGSLRNAAALAEHLRRCALPIAVIAAGERWPDGTLRPCVEDWLGAGAILSRLHGTVSPEAALARAGYEGLAANLGRVLRECASGVELAERGFGRDVELAGDLDVDRVAPRLRDGAFRGEP